MSHDLPDTSTPMVGVEADLPAAAMTRANGALAMGYEADPARQGSAIDGLYGFKRDMARSVNAVRQALGESGVTPGAAAYYDLLDKAGMQPGDPNMAYALASLTGLA